MLPLPNVAPTPRLDRVSVELTNRCGKACWFCYNHSRPAGATAWTPGELVTFAESCAAGGVKALSLGGGEPLEYAGLFDVLTRLKGTLFRSLTTNGLPLLRGDTLDRLIAATPDKVHVSIHFPDRPAEVRRVVEQVQDLQRSGVRSGVNFLVTRPQLGAARRAAAAVRAAGVGNDRIVYLPMRGRDTPTPHEMAAVAGGANFQSMSCLLGCAASDRFAAVGWDKRAAWCSYTVTRWPLPALTYDGLVAALTGLGLEFCGDTDAA